MANKKYLDEAGVQHFWDGIKPKINEKAKITLTGTDPGEGAVLSTGEYIAVYGAPDYSALIDLFYPVGSYYETSDSSFNPNTAWGGTWVEDTTGTFTVAQTSSGDFSTVGATGGNAAHTHTLNDSGYAKIIIKGNKSIHYRERSVPNWTDNYYSGYMDTAASSSDSQGYGATLGGATASGSSLPPYTVVKRWHRTA